MNRHQEVGAIYLLYSSFYQFNFGLDQYVGICVDKWPATQAMGVVDCLVNIVSVLLVSDMERTMSELKSLTSS